MDILITLRHAQLEPLILKSMHAQSLPVNNVKLECHNGEIVARVTYDHARAIAEAPPRRMWHFWNWGQSAEVPA